MSTPHPSNTLAARDEKPTLPMSWTESDGDFAQKNFVRYEPGKDIVKVHADEDWDALLLYVKKDDLKRMQRGEIKTHAPGSDAVKGSTFVCCHDEKGKAKWHKVPLQVVSETPQPAIAKPPNKAKLKEKFPPELQALLWNELRKANRPKMKPYEKKTERSEQKSSTPELYGKDDLDIAQAKVQTLKALMYLDRVAKRTRQKKKAEAAVNTPMDEVKMQILPAKTQRHLFKAKKAFTPDPSFCGMFDDKHNQETQTVLHDDQTPLLNCTCCRENPQHSQIEDQTMSKMQMTNESEDSPPITTIAMQDKDLQHTALTALTMSTDQRRSKDETHDQMRRVVIKLLEKIKQKKVEKSSGAAAYGNNDGKMETKVDVEGADPRPADHDGENDKNSLLATLTTSSTNSPTKQIDNKMTRDVRDPEETGGTPKTIEVSAAVIVKKTQATQTSMAEDTTTSAHINEDGIQCILSASSTREQRLSQFAAPITENEDPSPTPSAKSAEVEKPEAKPTPVLDKATPTLPSGRGFASGARKAVTSLQKVIRKRKSESIPRTWRMFNKDASPWASPNENIQAAKNTEDCQGSQKESLLKEDADQMIWMIQRKVSQHDLATSRSKRSNASKESPTCTCTTLEEPVYNLSKVLGSEDDSTRNNTCNRNGESLAKKTHSKVAGEELNCSNKVSGRRGRFWSNKPFKLIPSRNVDDVGCFEPEPAASQQGEQSCSSLTASEKSSQKKAQNFPGAQEQRSDANYDAKIPTLNGEGKRRAEKEFHDSHMQSDMAQEPLDLSFSPLSFDETKVQARIAREATNGLNMEFHTEGMSEAEDKSKGKSGTLLGAFLGSKSMKSSEAFSSEKMFVEVGNEGNEKTVLEEFNMTSDRRKRPTLAQSMSQKFTPWSPGHVLSFGAMPRKAGQIEGYQAPEHPLYAAEPWHLDLRNITTVESEVAVETALQAFGSDRAVKTPPRRVFDDVSIVPSQYQQSGLTCCAMYREPSTMRRSRSISPRRKNRYPALSYSSRYPSSYKSRLSSQRSEFSPRSTCRTNHSLDHSRRVANFGNCGLVDATCDDYDDYDDDILSASTQSVESTYFNDDVTGSLNTTAHEAKLRFRRTSGYVAEVARIAEAQGQMPKTKSDEKVMANVEPMRPFLSRFISSQGPNRSPPKSPVDPPARMASFKTRSSTESTEKDSFTADESSASHPPPPPPPLPPPPPPPGSPKKRQRSPPRKKMHGYPAETLKSTSRRPPPPPPPRSSRPSHGSRLSRRQPEQRTLRRQENRQSRNSDRMAKRKVAADDVDITSTGSGDSGRFGWIKTLVPKSHRRFPPLNNKRDKNQSHYAEDNNHQYEDDRNQEELDENYENLPYRYIYTRDTHASNSEGGRELVVVEDTYVI